MLFLPARSRYSSNFRWVIATIVSQNKSGAKQSAEKISYDLLPKAEITVPNVTKDLLMFAPSFNRSPVAPVELARSLKAIEFITIHGFVM